MSPDSVAYSLVFRATGMAAPPPPLLVAGCWDEPLEPVDAPPPLLVLADCWSSGTGGRAAAAAAGGWLLG